MKNGTIYLLTRHEIEFESNSEKPQYIIYGDENYNMFCDNIYRRFKKCNELAKLFITRLINHDNLDSETRLNLLCSLLMKYSDHKIVNDSQTGDSCIMLSIFDFSHIQYLVESILKDQLKEYNLEVQFMIGSIYSVFNEYRRQMRLFLVMDNKLKSIKIFIAKRDDFITDVVYGSIENDVPRKYQCRIMGFIKEDHLDVDKFKTLNDSETEKFLEDWLLKTLITTKFTLSSLFNIKSFDLNKQGISFIKTDRDPVFREYESSEPEFKRLRLFNKFLEV